MSRTFLVTREIPCVASCIGASAARESQSIPSGSTVTFTGSPEPKRVAVSWQGQSVTILARDFAEKTAVIQRAAAGLAS